MGRRQVMSRLRWRLSIGKTWGHNVMNAQVGLTFPFRIDFAVAKGSLPARTVALISGLGAEISDGTSRNFQ
jgi:hypothetical protein